MECLQCYYRVEKSGKDMAEQKSQDIGNVGQQHVHVNIPAHYVNGFALSLSNADISMLMMLDGQPIAKMNMSFTTAKTVVKLLTGLIENLEKVTERKIMTTDEVGQGLEKLSRLEGKP